MSENRKNVYLSILPASAENTISDRDKVVIVCGSVYCHTVHTYCQTPLLPHFLLLSLLHCDCALLFPSICHMVTTYPLHHLCTGYSFGSPETLFFSSLFMVYTQIASHISLQPLPTLSCHELWCAYSFHISNPWELLALQPCHLPPYVPMWMIH